MCGSTDRPTPPDPTPSQSPPTQIVDLGFDEHFYWDNIKLGLMVVACAFAMVAQFYPMPFPESRPLLGVCCVSYFLASTIIQLIVSYVEQDAILTTQPHEVNVYVFVHFVLGGVDLNAGIHTHPHPPFYNQQLAKQGLRVRTQFPRFQDEYTVILEEAGSSKHAPTVTGAFLFFSQNFH